MRPKFEDFDFPDGLEPYWEQLRTSKMNKHLIEKKFDWITWYFCKIQWPFCCWEVALFWLKGSSFTLMLLFSDVIFICTNYKEMFFTKLLTFSSFFFFWERSTNIYKLNLLEFIERCKDGESCFFWRIWQTAIKEF